MKRQSSDSSDQLKNATPRRSWDHTSPDGSENTSNNNQPPHTSASVSEHPPEPLITTQSFPTYAYGTSDYYNNRMDPNQMMMQNQMLLFNPMQNYQWSDNCMYPMPPVDSSCERSMESTSNGNNPSNFESQPQIQQTESVNPEGAARSPSPLVQYSDEEATSLMEKFRSEENHSFRSALQVFTSWLKNVEFTKSNSTYLISLISSAQSNVYGALKKKAKYKEELIKVNSDVSGKKNNISSQLNEISNVFKKARLQKVWDQFTRPQRKMITLWMKETNNIVSVLTKERAAESSDPDEDSFEKSKISNLVTDALVEELRKHKEELDSLRNQLGCAHDNNATIRDEIDQKNKLYENTFLDLDKQYEEMIAEMEEHKKFLQEVEKQNKNNNENASKSVINKDSQLKQVANSVEEEALKSKQEKCEEAHLVAVIGTFLKLHPFGATVDYISAYLRSVFPGPIDCWYIENLLFRFPNLFREESKGVGANLTKEWLFLGLPN